LRGEGGGTINSSTGKRKNCRENFYRRKSRKSILDPEGKKREIDGDASLAFSWPEKRKFLLRERTGSERIPASRKKTKE